MSMHLSRLKALFLAGTSTLWKTFEYGAIAFFNPDNIDVNPLSEYVLHHSAVEDRDTAAANLAKKFREIREAAAPFRRGGEHHRAFLKMFADRGGTFVGGMQQSMDRTYILGDDTTLAIPTPIWEIMLPTLRTLVVADSLKASPDRIEGDDDAFMSVADIGPIMAAVGQARFWEILRKSATQIPYYQYNPIKVYHQVSCAFTRLSDPVDVPPQSLNAHTLLHVYMPNGIEGDVRVPTDVLIPQTEHFLCLPESPEKPVASDYRDFLLNHSTRKKIVDKLMDIVGRYEKELPVPDIKKEQEETGETVSYRTRKRHARSLKIVQAAASNLNNYRLTPVGSCSLR